MNDIYVYDGGRGVIGGPTVTFGKSHVFQTEFGWAREASAPDWHSVRYLAGEGTYKPRCGAPVWLHGRGDGVLGIVPEQSFGPVCAKCSALEELNRQTEAE